MRHLSRRRRGPVEIALAKRLGHRHGHLGLGLDQPRAVFGHFRLHFLLQGDRFCPPLLGLAVSGATWVTFILNDGRTTDRPFLIYMAWALPLLVYLARQLYVARAPLLYRRSWPVDPTSAGRLSSPSTSTT